MDDRLLFAVINGNDDEVGRLLKKEVDVNAKNSHGWTLLHYAAMYNRLDAVELLLEKGADVMALTNTGDTPLHFASCNDRPQVACYLLDHGASLFAKRADGKSALDVAKNSEMVTTLLQHKEKWVTVKELHDAVTKKDDKQTVPMEVIWYRSIYMKLRDFLDYQQEQQKNDVTALREEMLQQRKELQLKLDDMQQQNTEQKKDIQSLREQLVRQEEASRQQHESLRLENKQQKEDLADLRDAQVRQQCAAQQQLKALRKENKEQKADMAAFRNQRRICMKTLDETNNAIHEKLKAIMQQHEQQQSRRVQIQQLQYRREQLQQQRWQRRQYQHQQQQQLIQQDMSEAPVGKKRHEDRNKALLLQDQTASMFELGKPQVNYIMSDPWATTNMHHAQKSYSIKDPASLFECEQNDTITLTQNPVQPPQQHQGETLTYPSFAEMDEDKDHRLMMHHHPIDAVTLVTTTTTPNDVNLREVVDTVSLSMIQSIKDNDISKRRTTGRKNRRNKVLVGSGGGHGSSHENDGRQQGECTASSNGTETCTDSSDDSYIVQV